MDLAPLGLAKRRYQHRLQLHLNQLRNRPHLHRLPRQRLLPNRNRSRLRLLAHRQPRHQAPVPRLTTRSLSLAGLLLFRPGKWLLPTGPRAAPSRRPIPRVVTTHRTRRTRGMSSKARQAAKHVCMFFCSSFCDGIVEKSSSILIMYLQNPMEYQPWSIAMSLSRTGTCPLSLLTRPSKKPPKSSALDGSLRLQYNALLLLRSL